MGEGQHGIGDERVENAAGPRQQPFRGLTSVRTDRAEHHLGQPPQRHADEPDAQRPQDDGTERFVGEGGEGATAVGLAPAVAEGDLQGQHPDQ